MYIEGSHAGRDADSSPHAVRRSARTPPRPPSRLATGQSPSVHATRCAFYFRYFRP